MNDKFDYKEGVSDSNILGRAMGRFARVGMYILLAKDYESKAPFKLKSRRWMPTRLRHSYTATIIEA